jgi:mannitol/fructose-specific phosphotransferase system IIA component
MNELRPDEAPGASGASGTPGTGATAGATAWRSIISAKPSGIARAFRKFIEPNIAKGKSLTERLAKVDPAPQGSVSTGAPASAEQKSDLSKLIDEINQKKGEVSLWAILFIRLKTIFTRDSAGNYDAEITKKAFSKIHNKKEFLQAALEFIASQADEENKAEYMRLLLKLCHGDPEGEKSFVALLIGKDPIQLAKLLMDNDVPDLNLDKDQCNALATALLKAGDDGVDLLKQFLDPDKLKIAKRKPDQCNNLAIALAGNKNGGVELLKQLLDPDKLKIAKWKPDQCNYLARALARAGKEGVKLLKQLLSGDGDKLKTTKWAAYQCNYLAIALARAEKDGVDLLKQLLSGDGDKLQTAKWAAYQCNNLAIALAKAEKDGVPLLTKLLSGDGDKLKTTKWAAYECNYLARALAKAEKEGVALLRQLLTKDKLQTARWNKNQCNYLARTLLDDKAGKDGVELLKEFLSKDKLPRFRLRDKTPEASRKKALDLLGQNPPDVAQLKGLILPW